MFTSKLKALDSDNSDDSELSDILAATTVTKEALEQKVLQQYQEALLLEKHGQYAESESLLKILLDSQILIDINVGKADSSLKTSFIHLKYCVTMNLGHCLVKQSKLDEGLDYYLKATSIEESDLNLWYKIGTVAMKLPDLKLAANAFAEGLKRSPNHWGCIDNLVTVLYALGDFMSCLYFIRKGVHMDSEFVKGHVFKRAILYQSPFLKSDFVLYYPGCKIEDNKEDVEEAVASRLISEAEELAERERQSWRPVSPPLAPFPSNRLVSSSTWQRLAYSMLHLYHLTYQKDPKLSIFHPVVFEPPDTKSVMEPLDSFNNSSHSECTSESIKREEENNGKGGTYEKWLSCQKRRSARVRSTVRKEEPSLARSLAHLIPSHLLHRSESYTLPSDNSMETMDLYRLFECKDSDEIKTYKKNTFSSEERSRVLLEDCYFGTDNEVEDIKNFISNAVSQNFTIVDCIKQLVIKLSSLWKFLWPENLARLYLKLFKIFLKHNPANVCRGNDLRTEEEDLSILMFGELLLDRWLNRGKSKGKLSPLGKTMLGGDFPSLYLGALDSRAFISSDPEILSRIFWLEGMLFYYTGDIESTTIPLEVMLNEPWFTNLDVKLPNVEHHYSINMCFVSNILKSLNINKSLSNVMKLYQGGYYEDVIEILSDSLLSEQLVLCSGSDYVLSRHRQFSIILDSFWKLSKFKECFYWTECFLFECLSEYKNSSEEEERTTNARYITSLLDGLLSLIDTVGNIIFGTLSSERQSRLVQTLSSIICIQMDVPESTTEIAIESIAPWILLYHIIKYDEELREKSTSLNISAISSEDLPMSLAILNHGHDYLGRRGWCCFNEGSLLYFSLDVMHSMLSTLDPESKAMSLITQEIDQVFYCLYGQQKKVKGRHIVEHNTLGLALTWNRAQQVFRFTKPKELPSYDSSGKCSINADTETLYLKLVGFVPEQCDPARLIPEMTRYIEGETEEIPLNNCMLPEDVTNIYYLLAHFYFRNKSWNKALKYYMLDVCANPNRVDSWACLALARGSLIETKINSCDVIKNENEVLKSADIVSRCYERSLRLDPLQSTLWIEKGSFSYMIHSFCSNLLKKELNLSLEMFDLLESKKEAMLSYAMDSFCKANKIWYSCRGFEIQDERWLHHYMMGKICEKKGDDPQVFIDHYIKSAELLHAMGAQYPSSICYASPQRLAVESLEIYYRVHASILKFLEKVEGKAIPEPSFIIFKRAVSKLSQSPFVLLRHTSKEEGPKNEPESSKVAHGDEPYSPGDDTTDCLSNTQPNSETPNDQELLKVASEKKTECKAEDLSLPQNPAAVVQIKDPCPEQITGGVSEKRELSSSLSTESHVVAEKESRVGASGFNICQSSFVDKAKVVKRALSIESDPPTSDSVSKTSLIGKQNKTSESSSDDSSSDSESSSDSSSSSESSSSTSDQDSDTKEEQEKKNVVEAEITEPINWDIECELLTNKCLQALVYCSSRFQEHFKSLYHLAYFYFKSKKYKDLNKVKKLLLEADGLFAERKSSNFFNGIWRIPNNEIDRPGNFASHMGRCIHLLLEYLKETRDYKMLIDLALFLKVIPEADKKYLRDTEREELCHEALSLAAISLRKKLAEISSELLLKPFLMDIYSIYKKVTKTSLKEPVFASILSDSFYKLTGQKSDNNLETDVMQYFKRDQISDRGASVKIGGSSSVETLSHSHPPTPITVTLPFPIPPVAIPPVIPTPAPTPTPTPTLPIPLPTPVLQVPPQLTIMDIQSKVITTCMSGSTGSSRGRGGGPKRPRGRPPGSSQLLRHSITSILQQRPELFRTGDPFRQRQRPSLSITPIPLRQRQPKPQPRHQLPASISITSVTSQPRPFSFQSVSITPRSRHPPPEPRLPPATIIPLPLQQHKPRSRTSTPKIGSTVPKLGSTALKLGPTPLNLSPTPSSQVSTTSSLGLTVPKMGPNALSLGPTSTSLPSTSPNLGSTASKLGPTTSSLGLTPPKLGPTPKPGPTAPKLGPTAPKLGPTTPKLGPTASKLGPTTPSLGPSPPKIPHLDFSVAQAIRNLGSTITITTSTGEPSKPPKPPSTSIIPTNQASSQKSNSDPNIQVIILDD